MPSASSPLDRTLLLTEAEVAAIFRVTPRTIRRWARDGWLNPLRIAGTTRYRAAELRDLTGSNDETQPGQAALAPTPADGCGRHASTG